MGLGGLAVREKSQCGGETICCPVIGLVREEHHHVKSNI